jgi:hypothetical protein
MRYQRHLAVALTAALIGIMPLAGVAAQDCSCPNRDSNANGRIAGALGGGLFAGLIAAVLGIKHASEASAQPAMGPAGGVGPGAAPTLNVSTGSLGALSDSLPDSSATPAAAAAPLPASVADAREPGGQRAIGDPAHHVAYMPPMSARDAREEGLVPAKTASLLPALAMMGTGALLLGLLLMREKSRGRRGTKRRRR